MYKAFIMLTQCAATDNTKRDDLFFFFTEKNIQDHFMLMST